MGCSVCVALSCVQPSVSSERRLAHRQGRRALKASLTLGVLLGLFFSAWLPFFISNMAQVRPCTHTYTAIRKVNANPGDTLTSIHCEACEMPDQVGVFPLLSKRSGAVCLTF